MIGFVASMSAIYYARLTNDLETLTCIDCRGVSSLVFKRARKALDSPSVLYSTAGSVVEMRTNES